MPDQLAYSQVLYTYMADKLSQVHKQKEEQQARGTNGGSVPAP